MRSTRFERGLVSFLLLCASFVPARARADWPTLSAAIDRARAAAPYVVDASGQLAVARAARAGAEVSWLTNPYVEFQAYKGNSTKDLAFYSFAMIPIEINGQRPSRIREADALAGWKSISREDTRAKAASFAVGYYGDALVARARVDVAVRAEADAKAEADLYAARLAAGDATMVDKSLADAELARYAQQHAESTLLLMGAKTSLAALLLQGDLGDPPSTLADPPPLHTATAEQFVQKVQTTSPQLRALSSESLFWRASSDRASRDKNIPVNFIVNFGRTDFGEFQVGGGLSWMFPITQRMQGPVAMADASADRAESMRTANEQYLGEHARSLFAQYEFVKTTIGELDKNGLPAQERVVDATIAAYRGGKIEFIRVLQARRDLALARGRRLDLVSTAWHRLADMTSLLGELP